MRGKADVAPLNVCCLPESGRNLLPALMTAKCQERTLEFQKKVEHWSLTTLREKLVKIGDKVERHGANATAKSGKGSER